MKKIVIAWIVCVLGLVGLFAWLGGSAVPTTHAEEEVIRGDFALQGADGKLVSNLDFKGKYLLVYFGFTHCPDICPTTLLLMNNAIDHLGNVKAKKIQPIFITLDPERDTPAIVGEYVKHFSEGIVGLSGSPAQIKTVADHYKVYYSKVEDKSSALGYVIDHSGFIYLIGPDGKYITHFPHNVSEQGLQDGLSEHVK